MAGPLRPRPRRPNTNPNYVIYGLQLSLSSPSDANYRAVLHPLQSKLPGAVSKRLRADSSESRPLVRVLGRDAVQPHLELRTK
jgi:hypothetical protein